MENSKECSQCKLLATCHCTWGLYEYTEPRTDPDERQKHYPRNEPMNEADLCKRHLDELWKVIHGAVNMGYMHFVIKSV